MIKLYDPKIHLSLLIKSNLTFHVAPLFLLINCIYLITLCQANSQVKNVNTTLKQTIII